MRAAIYARVSTDQQADNYSLPTQVARCQDFCIERGYEIVGIFEETFTSNSTVRPELDKLEALALSKSIDVVVALELDRWARDAADFIGLENKFKTQYNVSIQYALADYPDTPEGQFQKHVRLAMAQYERKKIVERTQRGRKGYAKAGKVSASRIAPYGYRYATKSQGGNGQFTVDPDEARIVQLIFTWLVHDRLALNAIASKLTQLGVPTKFDGEEREVSRKNPLKTKNRGIWAKSTVTYIVKNELYAGVAWFGQTVKVDKINPKTGLPVIDPRTGKPKRVQVPRERSEWIAVPVPAIVSRELWEAAQEQLKVNSKLCDRNKKEQYLLSGLCSCSRCGLALYAQGSRSRGYKRYRCGGNHNDRVKDGKTIVCHGGFNANELESLVWDAIATHIKNPEMIVATMRGKQSKSAKDIQVLQLNVHTLADAIAKKRLEKEKLLDTYLTTDRLSKEAFQERDKAIDADIASLDKDLTAAQVRLAEREVSDTAIEQVEAFCQEVAEGIDLSTFEDQRYTLELLRVKGMIQRDVTEDSDALILTGYIPITVIQLPRKGTVCQLTPEQLETISHSQFVQLDC